jgi:DNA repair protein RadD
VILRPYQQELFERVREAFRTARRVFMCLPTGGGKTAIFATMAASAFQKGRTIWICLPRHELITQASEALSHLNVPHGRITAGNQESKAFALHLVSSNTLIRRWDKIKTPPEFIILDEAHLYYDRQLEICERYPLSKILGVSASPERLDGRGLSDIYDRLVEGPGIRTLVEQGYLCPIRYYAPPLEGLNEVHRKGYEFDESELARLFERRKVYGKAVEHYERLAAGKTALVFARSIDEADKIAAEFRSRNWIFEPISGKTPKRQRRELLEAYSDGKIDGLVNCEIATYGLDVPRIECLILLRPTASKALQTQMIGRGLRASPHTGKKRCVILDHVNLIDEFGHPFDNYQWQFDGREKRSRSTNSEIRLRLCPETFLYCEKPSCEGCENNHTQRKTRAEEYVECQLRECAPPVPLNVRPVEEQAVFRNRLDDALDRAREAISRGEIDSGAIGELLALARQVDRQPMWVYWRLSEGRRIANVPLLAEIARQENYKPGWVYFARKKIAERYQRGRQ